MKFKPEQIDRGIVKQLEKTLALFGYWPDLEVIDPNDQVAMNLAIDQIKASGKEPIQVYGPAAPRDRMELRRGHVIVKRNYYMVGDIGYGQPICYEVENPQETDPSLKTYRKVQYADRTSQIGYEIRFVTDDTELHRRMDEYIHHAFGSRIYLLAVNADRSDDDDGFYLFQNGMPLDLNSPERVERMYRFRTDDVIISEPRILKENIKAVSNIEIEMGATQDPTDLDDTDNIEVIIE